MFRIVKVMKIAVPRRVLVGYQRFDDDATGIDGGQRVEVSGLGREAAWPRVSNQAG